MSVVFLLQTRPGFERDAQQEARTVALERRGLELEPVETGEGFVLLQSDAPLAPFGWRDLAFSRTLSRVIADISLGDRDRLTPILDAVGQRAATFASVWLEWPDTNDGKAMSGFARKFQPLLEEKLAAAGLLSPDASTRLQLFFPSKSRVLVSVSEPQWGAPWPLGILRLRMPTDAPSRSTLKLAEAFEVFLGEQGQQDKLKPGMTAVDLGAAPGGWTWQLLRRGIKVYAVDNGPMKGSCDGHPLVKHLRQDGFRFRPPHPVDWLVCDMVERPGRVAELMADWLAEGSARQAVFNLKLPMKKRAEALADALERIEARMLAAGLAYSLQVKQLYHDREEVTVYLVRPAAAGRRRR